MSSKIYSLTYCGLDNNVIEYTVQKVKGLSLRSQEATSVANQDMISSLIEQFKQAKKVKTGVPQFTFDIKKDGIYNHAFIKYLKSDTMTKRFLLRSVSDCVTMPWGLNNPYQCNWLQNFEELQAENNLLKTKLVEKKC